jgi:dihydrofolate synthase / folylpolyglutamate synthase
VRAPREEDRGRLSGSGAVSQAGGGASRAGGGARGESWTGERAERHLRSLELFGMRFGLDRMRRMMTVLGSPQRRFATVHVVGTNGKTSTTRMISAILERHGLRTGAYLSPHLISYSERVQVGERDLSSSAFAAAVARAAWAAERVNHTLAEDDHVTQFELLTAAAFWVLAEREVEVAVVEAGLGGRYDATVVVESAVTVLTNVGLEHTRWLGPTVHDIAAEKLAVVRPDTALVLGVDLHPDALAVARVTAEKARARVVRVAPEDIALAPSFPVASAPSLSGFQQRNFALARAASQTYLQGAGIAVREEALNDAALTVRVPGRMQVVADDPLTVLDGAHNPDAARALVESLPSVLAGGRLAHSMGGPPGVGGFQYQPAHLMGGPPGVGGFQYQLAHLMGSPPGAGGFQYQLALVIGVLEDKDAASMLAALLALCERAWFTAPPSPRALSPAALQSLARQQGYEQTVCEPQPRRALRLAQEWALAQPKPTAVCATGSIYLVGDLLAEVREREPAERRAAAAEART